MDEGLMAGKIMEGSKEDGGGERRIECCGDVDLIAIGAR
jgi:hypothetical protein